MYKVNRYKGMCIVCKQHVKAGEGRLRRFKNRTYIIGRKCKPKI